MLGRITKYQCPMSLRSGTIHENQVVSVHHGLSSGGA